MKEIYHAGTLEGAETALLRLGEKKRVIYTTNAIESLNGVIKKPPQDEANTALSHFYMRYASSFPKAA